MSREQSVLRNTVGYMLKNIGNQTTNGEEKSKPEVIKLGLDLHARQVTECRQLDGSTPKPAQQWDPWKLLDKVEEWVKAGSKVYSCYEAGPCGYWYHRELTKLLERSITWWRHGYWKTNAPNVKRPIDWMHEPC